MNDKIALLGVCLVLVLLLAGQFDNHFWRILCFCGAAFCFWNLENPLLVPYLSPIAAKLIFGAISGLLIWWVPHLRFKYKRQGCVFVTGADSGMGQETVIYLAKTNDKKHQGSYDCIFAGAYDAKKTQAKLKELCGPELMKKIKVVPLDVTSDTSVAQAARTVQDYLSKENPSCCGLTGLVNYHGVAFNGPLQYMPISMYQRQLDVNFVGNIRMTQQFLPLLKRAASKDRPGRIVYTGTGGGPCSPCPPLLSAYMSSKFAGEALAQSLRMELFMTSHVPIDVCVINPGFVKPTMLMKEGQKLTEQMWKACEDRTGSTIAKDEYGRMMDHFVQYSALVPGTHVSQVARAAEHALTAKSPRSSYKVGIDSKLAPIVGMLPTGVRELIARNGIYGFLSPAGTVKGYRV
jgi:NAD(P)-dependent dehydrogenase (short-subunit alcohol dehydrogenase family)